VDYHDRALQRAGVDRHEFFSLRRGLYDETMAHQDHQLERFVDELKAAGEWERTILIVSADHGHPAGTFARFGRGLIEPQPEGWQGALCDSYASRVPLLFVWPGRIPGGRRIAEPVSLIDVLPTVLELAGLPPAEMAQGRSLASLLLSERTAFGPGEHRPVFLDEFRVDDASGELVGNLDVVDGRWGASLEIGPHPQGTDALHGRHSVPAGGRWGAVHPFFPEVPRLLLYDLLADPFTVHAVNDEHPDLVEQYRTLLLQQWDAHRALAQQVRASGAGGQDSEPALTPEQLQQLQQLGYIR
jgi:arylsulfatase A-like enzyme